MIPYIVCALVQRRVPHQIDDTAVLLQPTLIEVSPTLDPDQIR